MSTKQFCDLHLHSNYSDGSMAPSQLVELAWKLGLGAIGLCDHNTLAGHKEFLSAARDRNIPAVAGVEITAEFDKTEVHILGLFIPEEARESVEKYLKVIKQRKLRSNALLLQNLQASGYDIAQELVRVQGHSAVPNRVHVAKALMNKGYVATIAEAFAQLLQPGQGYYLPPEKLDAFEVIRFLHQKGAVPVLAHPLLDLTAEQLGTFLPWAKRIGLQGLEALYSRFTPEQRALLQDLAQRYGLAISGGSDFHGSNRPDISMGTGIGDLAVPMEVFHHLEQLHLADKRVPPRCGSSMKDCLGQSRDILG